MTSSDVDFVFFDNDLFKITYDTMHSRMDQVKLVEDNL